MADYIFYTFAALALSLAGIWRFLPKRSLPDGTTLPPGPKPTFLVGNVLEMPVKMLEVKLAEWADVYGGMFRLSVFGKPFYVVSKDKIAHDLLKGRGSIYSSRPDAPSIEEFLGDHRILAAGPVDPKKPELSNKWRKNRKFLNLLLNPSAVKKFSVTHDLESVRFVLDLIKDPKSYETACERYSAGIVFRLIYGRKIETGKEFFVKESNAILDLFEEAAVPGAYLVDIFPIMKYIPAWIAPWKRYLLKGQARYRDFWCGMVESVKGQVEGAGAPPSMARDFVNGHIGADLEHLDGEYMLGTIYVAGVGTTANSLMTFIFSMVHHPSWMKQMQLELDKVVGDNRLPTFEDIPWLPTVRAVMKESLRWRPVAPAGVPHTVVQDDVYDGTFIPAGTTIVANIWKIHRDPDIYPDGETFNPDRWLLPSFPTYQEPLTKYPNLHNFSVFGFGRRICPGQHLAERSSIIAIARLVWACNIAKQIGPDGKEIDVHLNDFTGGLTTAPKPFQFSLTARDEHRLRIVESSVEEWQRNDPLDVKSAY